MEKKKLGTWKMLCGVVLAILILIVAQVISLAVGNLLVMIGLPAAVGNVAAGALYPVCALGGTAALCKWVLGLSMKVSMEQCKILKVHIKPLWCAAAVGMPILVSAVLILTPGHWECSNLSGSEIGAVVTAAVFFYGLGTGMVGILFSLVTYESGNIWNSALIHGVWNMVMIGGILQIGDTVNESAVYNYVLETKSFLLTGGDFGVEASAVAVAAYAAAAALAGWRIKCYSRS